MDYWRLGRRRSSSSIRTTIRRSLPPIAATATETKPPPPETEQLGFRLAHRAGHDRVYAVDVSDRFFEEAIELLIGEAVHAERWQALRAAGDASARQVQDALHSGTIADALVVMNQPEAKAAALAPYLDLLLPIASDGNWAGPDMVANWYRRNFRIAANVHAVADDGDRLALIYGAGHIPILEHVLACSSRFSLHDPLQYLSVM